MTSSPHPVRRRVRGVRGWGRRQRHQPVREDAHRDDGRGGQPRPPDQHPDQAAQEASRPVRRPPRLDPPRQDQDILPPEEQGQDSDEEAMESGNI